MKTGGVRRLVAEAAGEIGGEGGRAILQQLIQDENPEVRKRVAAIAAGYIGGEEVLALLQQLAQDEDSDVRQKSREIIKEEYPSRWLSLIQPSLQL